MFCVKMGNTPLQNGKVIYKLFAYNLTWNYTVHNPWTIDFTLPVFQLQIIYI